VFCRISHEALQDHADRNHLAANDNEIFEAYRELIEQVASDAFDAQAGVDEAGCVVVTKEALDRVGRSAWRVKAVRRIVSALPWSHCWPRLICPRGSDAQAQINSALTQ
jgi:hypothetical protein